MYPLTPLNFTATISNNPTPYVSAVSFINSNSSAEFIYGSASASLLYSFNINGTPSTLIPINYNSFYRLISNDVNNVGAGTISLDLYNDSGNILGNFYSRCQLDSCTYGTSAQYSPNTTFSLDGLILEALNPTTVPLTYSGTSDNYFEQGFLVGSSSFMLNEEGSATGFVRINALAEAQISSLGTLSAVSAFIDPYFFIDSDYLDQNPDASISFTQGVGNAPSNISAVPVPAALPLMASALGIFGIARRRNKSKAA